MLVGLTCFLMSKPKQKEGNKMRKLKLRQLSCALLVLAFVGFGCNNGGLFCEDIPGVPCTDGSIPQVCISLIDGSCGFNVSGEYYWCDCTTTLDLSCSQDALEACRGTNSPEDIDELDSEEFVDALESLKESVQD